MILIPSLIIAVGFGLTKASLDQSADNNRLHAAFEPQIAIKCNMIPQFFNRETKQWSHVEHQRSICASNLSDETYKAMVLNTCRKAYPDLDVRNIVEANQVIEVPNFCHEQVYDGEQKRRYNHEHALELDVIKLNDCRERIRVRPFRCLVGSFEGDPLLVPDGCLFNHTFDRRICRALEAWNHTVTETCLSHGRVLKTVSPLLPCGIDVFSGAEYVCCYPNALDTPKPVVQPESEIDEYYDEEDDEDEQTEDEINDISTTTTIRSTHHKHSEMEISHKDFGAAKENLKEEQQDKLNHVVESWNDFQKRYRRVKDFDKNQARTMKKEFLRKMESTVNTLEKEFTRETTDLIGNHDRELEERILDRKRDTRQSFIEAINEMPIRSRRIEKALHRYIRAEEKDRQHTLRKFKRTLRASFASTSNNDPSDVDRTLTHLNEIDTREEQAFRIVGEKLNREISRAIIKRTKSFKEQLREKSNPMPDMDNSALLSHLRYEEETNRALLENDDKPVEIATTFATQTDLIKPFKKLSHSQQKKKAYSKAHKNDPSYQRAIKYAPRSDYAFSKNSDIYLDRSPIEFSPRTNAHLLPLIAAAVAGVICAIAITTVAVKFYRSSSRSHGEAYHAVQVVGPEEKNVSRLQVHGYTNPFFVKQ